MSDLLRKARRDAAAMRWCADTFSALERDVERQATGNPEQAVEARDRFARKLLACDCGESDVLEVFAEAHELTMDEAEALTAEEIKALTVRRPPEQEP